MKTVMVIFEEIPENCKIFIIQADEKTFEFLKRINDQFINAVETDDDLQDEINEFFYTKNWTDKYVNLELPCERFQCVDLIIRTGIL